MKKTTSGIRIRAALLCFLMLLSGCGTQERSTGVPAAADLESAAVSGEIGIAPTEIVIVPIVRKLSAADARPGISTRPVSVSTAQATRPTVTTAISSHENQRNSFIITRSSSRI